MPVVNKIGLVEKVTIPSGWFELPRQPNPFEDSWARTFTLHSDPRVELSFKHRGAELDKASASAFTNLLQQRFDSHNETPLTPSEIRDLQVVMGYNTAGDNQHTFIASELSSRSSAHLSSVRQPTFELHTSCIRSVSQRPVLFVTGRFGGENFYAGTFYRSASNDRIVEEFMLHAPSQELFDQFLKQFESALKSIEWSK
jgi:hypothetical protein